jgi:hypothetical protein
MLIVQRITTYQGQEGSLVYGDDGTALCLVRQYPGPPMDLTAAIGPHILADLMLTVSANQWSSLCLHMPGAEVLGC